MHPMNQASTHRGGRDLLSGRPRRLAVAGLSVALLTATLAGSAFGEPLLTPLAANGVCQPTMSTPIQQPTREQLDAAGLGDIPLAPDSARRDLVAAPFSDSSLVTNPLFPISELDSAVLNGHVDGKVFHTETTLLRFTQIIEWTPGQCVRVLESQYMAFLDGRLQETAIDLYAQADDGSVWYLGESVFDYDENGLVITTEGTWHAGAEGPAAMIMPSSPNVGDANRPENIPGTVFEEVVVKKIDQTIVGPSGPISGVMIGTETHQDGTLSDKVFAPGYGEFRSTDGGDLEAMALASPIDSLAGGVPIELMTITDGADRIFDSQLATAEQWRNAEKVARGILAAWDAFRGGDVPPRLIKPTRVALKDLATEIAARDRTGTRAASIEAAYAGNDLQLRYRSVTEVDKIRFELWVRQALVDAAVGSIGGVRSDVVTLEWIRDRIAHAIDPVALTRIDALVGELGTAVVDDDRGAAADAARALRELMSGLI